MVNTISRVDLQRKIENKDAFYLVETLSRISFEHAHLPGAINIPSDQVKELAPKILPDKHAEIVVYCASPT